MDVLLFIGYEYTNMDEKRSGKGISRTFSEASGWANVLLCSCNHTCTIVSYDEKAQPLHTTMLSFHLSVSPSRDMT